MKRHFREQPKKRGSKEPILVRRKGRKGGRAKKKKKTIGEGSCKNQLRTQCGYPITSCFKLHIPGNFKKMFKDDHTNAVCRIDQTVNLV